MVQKRPVGLAVNKSPSAEKLAIIEKILEPLVDDIINEYFTKANECLPLLDEQSFRDQYLEDKTHISPALLSCLYAHTLVYWRHSPTLSGNKCPDDRFIWNLANEAVYSELYLSPGISIIKAILLNISGRPTTSIIGNGVLLGSAVSMAHSLGLNHNPLPWKIPQSEKYLRMKLWWSLLLHDRWLSLAHGTPPHISRIQYDVPLPTLECLCEGDSSEARVRTANVFIALVRLTDVLDQHLQRVYAVDGNRPWDTTSLELALNNWVESLTGSCRLIVIRGSRLEIPGAANLRLAYLTTRLLLQRMELEAEKRIYDQLNERIMNRYIQARRTAEEILLLLQELQVEQLGGFWLPVTAFAFPATVNFLLRCALEMESSLQGLARSSSFRIAQDIVATLRKYQKQFEWDLADICVAQHAEIVDRILGGVPREEESDNNMDIQEFSMPDASILDQYFPSLWDPLQNAW
ncbi:N-terminal binuclear Zn cluster-containing/DNA binding domain-containing protein [Metarhizium brunneum]